MSKLIAVSAGLLALTAFTAMPAGKAMAQMMPAPVKPADCFGDYLTCLGGALQDAFCCANPDAQQCAPAAKRAPAPSASSDLMKAESCQQQFHDDVNGCDGDLVACLTGHGGGGGRD